MLPPPERDPDEPRDAPLEDPREGDEVVVLGEERLTVPLEGRLDEEDLDGAVKDRKTLSRTELGRVTRLFPVELERPTSLEG